MGFSTDLLFNCSLSEIPVWSTNGALKPCNQKVLSCHLVAHLEHQQRPITAATQKPFNCNLSQQNPGPVVLSRKYLATQLAVSDMVPLTAVFLIAAVSTVGHVVTPPGLRNALTVSTLKLKRRTRARRLPMRSRKSAKFRRLVPTVPAVRSPVTHLVSGQAGVHRPAGEGGAVLAGGFVTPVTTVVLTVTEVTLGYAACIAAGEFIIFTSGVTCPKTCDTQPQDRTRDRTSFLQTSDVSILFPPCYTYPFFVPTVFLCSSWKYVLFL